MALCYRLKPLKCTQSGLSQGFDSPAASLFTPVTNFVLTLSSPVTSRDHQPYSAETGVTGYSPN